MRILILGGTGFIGKHLIPALIQKGYHVTVLSRKEKTTPQEGLEFVLYDGKTNPDSVLNIDVIINLAGAGIADHKWTATYKKEILESRINAVQACQIWIKKQKNPPKLHINASAVGYYGTHLTKIFSETDEAGNDFLATTCKKWEDEIHKISIPKIIFRIGIVLGKDGGAFPMLVKPFKFYAGGHIGTGKQGFPWIHTYDVVQAFLFAIQHSSFEGVYNLVAPEITDNKTISKKLAKALHTHSAFPLPAFLVHSLLGERAILLTEGQKVSCQKLQQTGFQFRYSTIDDAIQELLS